MAEEARNSVRVRAFQGFSTDLDPHDAPPGVARLSLNFESVDPGVLRSRKGYKAATFESGGNAVVSDFASITFFDAPHARFVVGKLADGTELFMRNPSV